MMGGWRQTREAEAEARGWLAGLEGEGRIQTIEVVEYGRRRWGCESKATAW